jgi:hypothetical protein
MAAALLFHERRLFDDGAIMEMTIWRVPRAVPPTTHGLPYAFVSVEQLVADFLDDVRRIRGSL